MVFPLNGNALTKYVAYIDLEENVLVYMDVNFGGTVQSARVNEGRLSSSMPAFVEYLDSLPSVDDLFGHAHVVATPDSDKAVPVLYSDKEYELKDGQPAYVFKQENQDNKFQKLDPVTLL